MTARTPPRAALRTQAHGSPSSSAGVVGLNLTLGGLAGLVVLLLTGSPTVAVAALSVPMALLLGVWRTCLAVSFLASVLRSGAQAEALPELVWYALQFGPLLVGIPACFVRRRAPRRPVDVRLAWALPGLAVLALASSLWSTEPTNTAQQAGLFILVSLFLASTLTWRWTDMPTVREDITFLFALLAVVNGLGVAAGALGEPSAFGYYGRFQGLLSNPNYAGILAAIAISLGAYLLSGATLLRRVAVLLAMAVQAGALVWSGSRGAMLALVLGLLAASVAPAGRRVRRFVLGFSVLTAIVLPLVVPLSSVTDNVLFTRSDKGVDFSSGRLVIWSTLLHRWREQPLLGTGFRTVEELNEQTGYTAHNIYLSFLVELGVVGLVVFLGVVLLVLTAGTRRGDRAALLLAPPVTVLAVELTEASIHGFGNATALTSWVALLAFAGAGRADWVQRTQATAQAEPSPDPGLRAPSRPVRESRTIRAAARTR